MGTKVSPAPAGAGTPVLKPADLCGCSSASIRIRQGWRLFALVGVALLGAALLNEPWLTLLVVSAIYLALLPFSMASYARVKQRRAAQAAPASAAVPGSVG